MKQYFSAQHIFDLDLEGTRLIVDQSHLRMDLEISVNQNLPIFEVVI